MSTLIVVEFASAAGIERQDVVLHRADLRPLPGEDFEEAAVRQAVDRILTAHPDAVVNDTTVDREGART